MPILITGFHSSGVDMLAETLENNGVYFGEPHERRHMSYNHFARIGIALTEQFTHDSLDDLKFTEPYKNKRWHKTRRLRVFNHIIQIVSKDLIDRNKGVDWGFRSRRALIHLPLYKKNIKKLSVVIPFRNPYSLVESLYKNKPYNKNRGHGNTRKRIAESWVDYHSIAKRDIKDYSIQPTFVSYESLLSDPKIVTQLLMAKLGYNYVDGSELNINVKKDTENIFGDSIESKEITHIYQWMAKQALW